MEEYINYVQAMHITERAINRVCQIEPAWDFLNHVKAYLKKQAEMAMRGD